MEFTDHPANWWCTCVRLVNDQRDCWSSVLVSISRPGRGHVYLQEPDMLVVLFA